MISKRDVHHARFVEVYRPLRDLRLAEHLLTTNHVVAEAPPCSVYLAPTLLSIRLRTVAEGCGKRSIGETARLAAMQENSLWMRDFRGVALANRTFKGDV